MMDMCRCEVLGGALQGGSAARYPPIHTLPLTHLRPRSIFHGRCDAPTHRCACVSTWALHVLTFLAGFASRHPYLIMLLTFSALISYGQAADVASPPTPHSSVGGGKPLASPSPVCAELEVTLP